MSALDPQHPPHPDSSRCSPSPSLSSDRRRLCRRQGREPRRADPRAARARGLRHRRARLRRLLRGHRTARAAARRAARPGLDVEDTAALQAASRRRPRAVRPHADPARAARGDPCSPTRRSPARTPDAPVAVRSSATAEDTASASFAGMNETFLNVRGADAVIDAVRRCWRSLFGARTIYYRAVSGLRAGRHGHRGRRAAPDRLDARGRDVHRQPRHRRARTSS